MKKDLIKFNDNLTKNCQYIFGDIVTAAYYIVPDYRDYSAILYDSSCKELDGKVRAANIIENKLSFDGNAILVVFANGKNIRMTWSEWGDFDNIENISETFVDKTDIVG